jgi:hypothetical protein
MITVAVKTVSIIRYFHYLHNYFESKTTTVLLQLGQTLIQGRNTGNKEFLLDFTSLQTHCGKMFVFRSGQNSYFLGECPTESLLISIKLSIVKNSTKKYKGGSFYGNNKFFYQDKTYDDDDYCISG